MKLLLILAGIAVVIATPWLVVNWFEWMVEKAASDSGAK